MTVRFRRNQLLDATAFACSDGRGGLIKQDPPHLAPRRWYVVSSDLLGCDTVSFPTLAAAKDGVRDALRGSGMLRLPGPGRTVRY